MTLKVNIILSKTFNNVIGIDNNLIYRIKDDLLFFKNITSNTDDKRNVVIMGFNTWISIPNRPLKDRINIILTKDKSKIQENKEDTYVFNNLEDVFRWLQINNLVYNKIFIIGGSSIYDQILKKYRDMINNIYITEIQTNFYTKDKYKLLYFNDELKDFSFTEIEKLNLLNQSEIYSIEKKKYESINIKYKFYLGVRHNKNSCEKQYLNLLKDIITENNIKISRNSKVYSKFGVRMEFNLLNGFPLLTTKKMPWKTILRELIWFIKGETDNKILKEQKVHIWDLNSTKEFLESRNLSYQIEGDLGPIYGFQWRHFGAEYIDCDSDYQNKGIDQLKYVINEIKENPSSRRIIMSSWNPIDIPKMALPPCHVMIQFNIEPPFIDAQLYQRSGDMFLGVPFNIASYSFLLSIIGHICNYIPRKLIHIIGDAHIYENHIEAVSTQLSRMVGNLPKLEIKELDNIDNITEDMFKIHNYNPEPAIKAEMIP